MTMKRDHFYPRIEQIAAVRFNIGDVVAPTPLQLNPKLSNDFESRVFLKREDLQMVRSYKIRGAYNKIKSLSCPYCSLRRELHQC